MKNARGGAFCEQHEELYGNKCRVRNCTRLKVDNTQACVHHQQEWQKYKLDHSRSSLAGVKRMIQRPNENNPWQPGLRRAFQPHDDDDKPEVPRKNYFGPGQFYCVETICAPCGVVIAWTKFDKSESPTNLLNFLKQVYPTEESQPNYICIDKACRVLRTAIASKSWEFWKKQLALLLIPIITSITAKQTFCVEHIVILVHSMVQLQILLKLLKISRDGHIFRELSIHRHANN